MFFTSNKDDSDFISNAGMYSKLHNNPYFSQFIWRSYASLFRKRPITNMVSTRIRIWYRLVYAIYLIWLFFSESHRYNLSMGRTRFLYTDPRMDAIICV